MQAQHYDYIFLGAGCASLSIIMRMLASNEFDQKKILLIERERKVKNDRTWCFWEKTPGFFEDIVYHKWNRLFFKTGESETILEMGNYTYKMIRGIDFYEKCFPVIDLKKNIDVVYGEISFAEPINNSSRIKINEDLLLAGEKTIVFNSLYIPALKQKNKFYLLQHFKGWIIETPDDFFNEYEATLMDFSVAQNNGATFVYVLPLSSKKALVEYTLFSKELLPARDYDAALKNYIDNCLTLNNYKICEEEFGVIPMTNENFSFFKNGIYNIGTAGGQTKASTGYTFQFIQKQADEIIKGLISKDNLSKNKKIKMRFLFYDSTLLHILSKDMLEGKTIFSTLFKKNPAHKVLKFLDNETTIKEEIKLLNSLPKKIFIKAGFKELMKEIFFRKKKSYK
jgi:lycopene beta-cyclase